MEPTMGLMLDVLGSSQIYIINNKIVIVTNRPFYVSVRGGMGNISPILPHSPTTGRPRIASCGLSSSRLLSLLNSSERRIKPIMASTEKKPSVQNTQDRAQRTMDSVSRGDIGQRQIAAAAERNTQPILDVLVPRLRDLSASKKSDSDSFPSVLLEAASGTGQHAAAYAMALNENIDKHDSSSSSTWVIQPSDQDEAQWDSIKAWAEWVACNQELSSSRLVLDPIRLDCRINADWNLSPHLNSTDMPCIDCVVCVNMCHISEESATIGLFHGSRQVLRKDGLLFIYGPFLVNGKPTTESNARFHEALKSRNASWGLRCLNWVDKHAQENGFKRIETIDMPANNFFLIYSFASV